MHRHFVQLCFKGTRYHGWQIQPNAISIQEVLENAFSILLQERIGVVGAGRTDTGVHASFYVLHFDTANEISNFQKLIYRLNSILPSDIAIRNIWEVPPDAHARFSALSRTYKYFITLEKDPFVTNTHFYLRLTPDVDKMNEAARLLMNYTDFTSFCRLHSDVKTNLCEISRAQWEKENNRLVFTIKADRFLRNMVRAIVGTLLDVGKGKISLEDLQRIIEIQNRGAAGTSAPAHGLFLADVEYPAEYLY